MSFPQPWSQFVLSCKDSKEAGTILNNALESMGGYKFLNWNDNDYAVVVYSDGKKTTWDDVFLYESKTDTLLIINTIDYEEGKLYDFNYLLAKRLADISHGS